jgi:hypothetical protein
MNTRPDTAGMHSYLYTSHDGVEIECFFNYTSADRGEYGESLGLVYALVKGEDIAKLLSKSTKGFIETVALAKFQKDRQEESKDSKAESYRSNRAHSNFFGCGRLA